MNGAAWLLVISTLGVDFGWQIAPDGKLEYIIQIPLSQYEAIRDNPNGVDSNIPPEVVRHIQRIRIVVGDAQLPRDALPSAADPATDFAPGNTGNQRFRPRGVGLPAGRNDNQSGTAQSGFGQQGFRQQGVRQPEFGQPGFGQNQESNVTPIVDDPDGLSPDLPGPRGDSSFDNRAPDFRNPDYSTIPPPPITRASTDVPDFSDFGTGRTPQAVIRRNSLDVTAWQPNTSAPGFYNESPTRMFGDNSRFPDRQATYNTNTFQSGFGTQANRFGVDNRNRVYDPNNGPSVTAVGITVCALLFSIGLNLFLGWLAWEYYLKYRESFESWRTASRS